MKNLLTVLIVFLFVCSCGNKKGTDGSQVDSTAVDTVAVVPIDSTAIKDSIAKADSTAIVAYLQDLYNYVLKNKGNEEELASHFTDDVKNRLEQANEYEGGGLAYWELRTGFQDGPSDVSKVKSITKKDEWYVVKYLDMGNSGTTKFKAEVQDGKVIISDYKTK